MLLDTEFRALTKVDPANLSPEVEPFTWFSLELDEARDPQTGELLCPNFKGTDTALWEVKPRRVAKPHKRVVNIKKEEEKERAANLARYIAQGYAFEAAVAGEEDED